MEEGWKLLDALTAELVLAPLPGAPICKHFSPNTRDRRVSHGASLVGTHSCRQPRLAYCDNVSSMCLLEVNLRIQLGESPPR